MAWAWMRSCCNHDGLYETLIYFTGAWVVYRSLVPRPHPLTIRNGLVNQVQFLGLVGAFVTV